MIITIEGYRSHNLKLFRSLGCAAKFYGDKLLGKRMSRNILLEIKLTKDLKQKEQAYGFCHITDDDLNRPREFLIELDTSMKNSFRQILIWLAHEMVHLYQMTVIKDPYSNHNDSFYSFKESFKKVGLKLYR